MSENTYRCPACRASCTTRGALPPGNTIRCGKCRTVFNVQPDGRVGPRPPAFPLASAAEKAKRPPADEEGDSPRTKRQGPSRGGPSVAVILVGVGLAAVLLCVAPLTLVAVVWFALPRAPTSAEVSRPKQQQADLRREILGQWSSGPDRATHEFLPDGLYVRRAGDVPSAGSYDFVGANEIDLVTRPRPDQPRTERFRVELNNSELTLASAGGARREVCRRVPDPAAAATDARLAGAWVGDGQDARGAELEFTAGKEFHQTGAGAKTSGSWRLAGVNLLERKYPAGVPTDYATVRLGPDTLELISQSGAAVRFRRRAGGRPTASGLRVELKKRKTLARQDQVFDGVTVSPGGELLAVRAAFEGTIRLLPALGRGEPREVATKEPVDRLVFSPDGKTLALGHTFTGKIRLLDVKEGAVTGEVSHPDKRFVEIAYLPDGGLLAIGPDRTITWDAKKGKTTNSVATPKVRGLPLYKVAPAGQFVACPGEKPGEVITWNPWTGKAEILAPAPGTPFARVERIAISTDGTKVAIEGPDQGVELWDARARERAGTM